MNWNWGRTGIYALVLSVISLTLLSFLPSSVHQLSNGYVVTNVQDDNVEEYRRLGLTPNHSVKFQITDLDGNPIEGAKSIVYHGRFLHITDMHPDEFNVVNSSIPKKCHAKDKKALPSEISHQYGDSMSGCDSPMLLYTDTLQWVRENLKDKIDFVIWTGDNIRHDNDRNHPRMESEILEMNQRVADKMEEIFMDDGEELMMPEERRVKIVPSLGNNDVYPHNLVAPGPTLQTREMYKIWRSFVPAEQMHTFNRGIYYFREVIPGRLAVLSINTLYFFKSNPLNDNCDNRKQPGYKLFEWLSVTLKELRRRHMKVWLSGHVPPIPKNLHYSCYSKMAVWMHEYRDIIIGGLWGHMNTDHFVPLDSVKAWKSISKRLNVMGLEEDANSINFLSYNATEEDDNDDFSDDIEMYKSMGLFDEDFGVLRPSRRYDKAPVGKVTYLEDIRDQMLAKIAGKKNYGKHGDRYSFAHITASVIPTYNSGFRVWEYNVTDLLSNKQPQESFEPWDQFFANLDDEFARSDSIIDELDTLSADDPKRKQYYSLKQDITIPPIMPPEMKLGPGYTHQLFSPERYVQYFADLGKLGKDDEALNYDVEYSTDEYPYNMSSLLVEDWINLARRLSESSPAELKKHKKDSEYIGEGKKLWKAFVNRAFIDTGYQNYPFATN